MVVEKVECLPDSHVGGSCSNIRLEGREGVRSYNMAARVLTPSQPHREQSTHQGSF